MSLISGRLDAVRGSKSDLVSGEAVAAVLTDMSEAMAELIAVLDGEDARQQAITILRENIEGAVADARQRVSQISDLISQTTATKH